MLRVGRNDAPFVLVDALMDGTLRWCPDDLRPLVADAWTMAEFPQVSLGTEMWVRLFEVAQYSRPADPLTIYRGCSPRRLRRMAWTLDEGQARWFALRFLWEAGAAGRSVYRATVAPDAVLAVIDDIEEDGGRGEQEVVVDPRRLGKITRIETLPVYRPER